MTDAPLVDPLTTPLTATWCKYLSNTMSLDLSTFAPWRPRYSDNCVWAQIWVHEGVLHGGRLGFPVDIQRLVVPAWLLKGWGEIPLNVAVDALLEVGSIPAWLTAALERVVW